MDIEDEVRWLSEREQFPVRVTGAFIVPLYRRLDNLGFDVEFVEMPDFSDYLLVKGKP